MGRRRSSVLRLLAGVVLVAALSACGAPPAAFNEGKAAYIAGDYATALEELLPFAEQGHAGAQLFLGVMYGKGWGVPQDYAAATKWFRKSAEQGNALAQGLLGAMYYESKGVTQNYAEALNWYRKSAEQGVALAQLGLGIMYAGSKGVTQDYVAAHMWFSLAAELGNEDAKSFRDIIAKKMTPAQIAEADRLSREWKP